MLSKERIGKITGSRVGAILGLNPYTSRSMMLKEMVDEFCGRLENKSNSDIERGHKLESVGILVAQKILKRSIVGVGFKIHKEYEFLGATPDGMTPDREFLVEIKAPRNFYEEIPPMYMAQMQLQMAVFGCDKCLFVQVQSMEQFKYDIVERDKDFIKNNLNEFKKFMEEYEQAIKLQDDFIVTALSEELVKVRESMGSLKKEEERLKREILSELGGKEFANELLSVKQKSLAPTIDYARFIKDKGYEVGVEYIKERGMTWEIRLN